MHATMEGCAFRDAMAFTVNAYLVSLGQDVKVGDSRQRGVNKPNCIYEDSMLLWCLVMRVISPK